MNKGIPVIINGGSAEVIVPASDAMRIISEAQLRMPRVLATEIQNTDLNIYSVMAVAPVNTRLRKMTRKDRPTAEEIGDYMVNLYSYPSTNVLHKIP